MAPDAVVLAESADDIARALAVASEVGVPIVPSRRREREERRRRAGRGRHAVVATLGMNKIKEIDRRERLCVVEPGLILADLHAAVEAEGSSTSPDANSLKMCALGGNIAENAGGPRAFKYGVTRDYVLGLDVLLMDGTARLRTGRRTTKGVTGYDVTALLVGSEGTLAVDGRGHAAPRAEARARWRRCSGLFTDVAGAGGAVEAIIAAGLVPRCIEPPGRADDSTRCAARGVGVDARAGALLLLEVDGDPLACEAAMEQVGGVCADAGAIEVLAAQDQAQRDRGSGEARRQMSPATRAMARFKISEDVVVPRTRVVELLGEVGRISEATRGSGCSPTATRGTGACT